MDLLVALLCLIWGSTWLVIQTGLRDLPPLTSCAVRFLLAAAVMAALAPALHRREGGERPTAGLTVAMGVLNFSLSYGIVYWTETILPSGLVCLLWGVFPIMLAAIGWFLLPEERLAPAGLAGLLVGFVGLALLLSFDVREVGPRGIIAGLVLLLSPASAALGTALVKRRGSRTSSVLLNRNGLALGAVILSIAAWVAERDRDVNWTPAAVGSVVYLALLGTVTTFAIYFWLLRHTSAARLSLVAYLTPVIAVTLGVMANDEPLTGWTVAGASLIFGGVALTRAPRRRRRSRAGPEADPQRDAAQAASGTSRS